MNTKYNELITIENLFQAWSEFKKGKKKKKDIVLFERYLEDNLFRLNYLLKTRNYHHGGYESFFVLDPKQRHIHKARIVDRIIHHLLYFYLYKLFDKNFIYDLYLCRLNKGTHKAVDRLEQFIRKISKNYSNTYWVLKCDIKKFFASIDHDILIGLLTKKIKDKNILWLIKEVIKSFQSEKGIGKGMPLGNLTSQIFSNIYLNELDQFVKHKLKYKYYIRYADDFLFIDKNKENLLQQISKLKKFLETNLKLEFHPKKIIIRPLHWGIDFLGYIVLPHYRLIRTKTKNRMFKKLKEKNGTKTFNQSLQSYLGYLKHANSFKIRKKLFMIK